MISKNIEINTEKAADLDSIPLHEGDKLTTEIILWY